jgi:hypothetical protein
LIIQSASGTSKTTRVHNNPLSKLESESGKHSLCSVTTEANEPRPTTTTTTEFAKPNKETAQNFLRQPGFPAGTRKSAQAGQLLYFSTSIFFRLCSHEDLTASIATAISLTLDIRNNRQTLSSEVRIRIIIKTRKAQRRPRLHCLHRLHPR